MKLHENSFDNKKKGNQTCHQDRLKIKELQTKYRGLRAVTSHERRAPACIERAEYDDIAYCVHFVDIDCFRLNIHRIN